MIAHLEGKIILIKDKFLIIDINGVGYKVFTTPDIISSYKIDDTTSLFIYTAVRENSIDLYGFETEEENAFFEMLLDVSGIGPKSALSILSIASIDILKKAIATGDTSYLNKVSGIGKKTADKIVLELRDKMKAHVKDDDHTSLRDEGDVIEALKSLGYSQSQARDAAKEIDSNIKGANARIKEALKILATRN